MNLFDLAVATQLVVLGALALDDDRPLRAVFIYIAFGTLMAVAWLRLEAPDLALAEAAIGAGITGLLLLDLAGRLRRSGGHG